MTPIEWAVTIGGLALIVAVNVYFFAPRKPTRPPDPRSVKRVGGPGEG